MTSKNHSGAHSFTVMHACVHKHVLKVPPLACRAAPSSLACIALIPRLLTLDPVLARSHLPQEGPQVQQHIASELHRNQERVADGALKPYKMDQQMFTAALMKYKESPIVQQTMEACQQRQAQLFAGLGMTG